MNTVDDIFPKIDALIDDWCARRALKPLRFILQSYPLANGLTDDFGMLLDSLKDIKGLCGTEITAAERNAVVELINRVEDIVHGPRG